MARGRTALATALFAVSFGTNVATPLLLIYEQRLSLSAWTVTALFAVYPLGLAPALAYAGPASDAIGRRSMVLPGVLLSGLASVVMLAGSDTLWLLFVGRFLLGAVSGMVLTVASAWMQELGRIAGRDPMVDARLIGTVMYLGFGTGPLVSGLLGQWSGHPLVWPYVVHLALIVVGLAVLALVPETVTPTGGPIRPNLGIPAGARARFWRVIVPTALGVFGFPSLVFGLFPVLLRPAMADIALFVTGVVFLVAMGLIVPTQAWVGRIGARRAAPLGLGIGTAGTTLGLVAFAADWWPMLFPASMAMGVASGMCITSGLRFVEEITSSSQRGALTGAFYAAAYAGMTNPLIAATAARLMGFEAVLSVLVAVGAGLWIWVLIALRRADGSVTPVR